MNNYNADLSEHRRLAILIFLERLSNRMSNASVVTDVLNSADVAVTSSRAQVGTEFSWLAEQGLVKLTGEGDFASATITSRGIDVAIGRATQYGIKRPTPRP